MSIAPRRVRVLAVLAVLALPATAAFVGASPAGARTTSRPAPKLAKPAAEGKRQAAKFLSLLTGTATPALKAFLSPNFILQRADGTSATRTQYLKKIANIKSFVITDAQATQQGAVLVVRYTAQVDQIIDGKQYKQTPAPRLSTFIWNGRAWTLIAHANFNTPQ